MHRFHISAAALLGLLLLSGCQNNSSTVSSSETTATSLTEVTAETPPPVTTAAPTLPTETGTISLVTTTDLSAEATTTLPEPLATAQVILTTQQIGGQGGEEHAEDPEPLYFTYRFAEDSVSMRLAGGNYQTIYYDFSETVKRNADELYTLSDFDFDGNPDLVIPVQFSNSNTVYAIFLWNPETMYYAEEPLSIINPVPYAESKTITSLAKDSAAVWIMTTYALQDGTLTVLKTAAADFNALTLTVQSPDGETEPAVKEFASTEELETALINQS